jgi:hypothetical protein
MFNVSPTKNPLLHHIHISRSGPRGCCLVLASALVRVLRHAGHYFDNACALSALTESWVTCVLCALCVDPAVEHNWAVSEKVGARLEAGSSEGYPSMML